MKSDRCARRQREYRPNAGLRAESMTPDNREVRGSIPRFPISNTKSRDGCASGAFLSIPAGGQGQWMWQLQGLTLTISDYFSFAVSPESRVA